MEDFREIRGMKFFLPIASKIALFARIIWLIFFLHSISILRVHIHYFSFSLVYICIYIFLFNMISQRRIDERNFTMIYIFASVRSLLFFAFYTSAWMLKSLFLSVAPYYSSRTLCRCFLDWKIEIFYSSSLLFTVSLFSPLIYSGMKTFSRNLRLLFKQGKTKRRLEEFSA